MVQEDIKTIPMKTKGNVKHIQEAMKQLEQNKNIVIRPADKGGGSGDPNPDPKIMMQKCKEYSGTQPTIKNYQVTPLVY